ncbi:MAG: hypothetical protein V1819_02160 [bacterium]
MLELSELILFNGNWDEYEEKLYSVFKKDFLDSRPYFKKILPVGIKKEPKLKSKEATFWHIITYGKIEDQRLPDLRKCERIGWIKPIIEVFPHQDIKAWIDRRGKDERICLCYGDWDFMVVLRKMKDYILLITAYPVERRQTREQLKSQYEHYLHCKKTNTAF